MGSRLIGEVFTLREYVEPLRKNSSMTVLLLFMAKTAVDAPRTEAETLNAQRKNLTPNRFRVSLETVHRSVYPNLNDDSFKVQLRKDCTALEDCGAIEGETNADAHNTRECTMKIDELYAKVIGGQLLGSDCG